MIQLFRLPVLIGFVGILYTPALAALTQSAEMPTDACGPAINAYFGNLPSERTGAATVRDVTKGRMSSVTGKNGVTLSRTIRIVITHDSGEVSTIREDFGIEESGTEVANAARYLTSLQAFADARSPRADIVHVWRREESGFQRNSLFSVDRNGRCVSARLYDLPFNTEVQPLKVKR